MDKNILLIVSILIAILIGTVLMIPLVNKVSSTKNIVTATQEQITVASGTATLDNDDLVTFTNMKNSSTVLVNNNLSTEVRVNVSFDTGIVTTSYKDGGYNVTYTAYSDDYIKEGTSRNLTSLIIVFFALALVATALIAITKSGILGGYR